MKFFCLKISTLIFILLTGIICTSCNWFAKQNQNLENDNADITPVPRRITVEQSTSTPTPTPTPVPTPTPEIPVNTKLSEFSTELLDRSWPRVNNIKLASKAINGYIVKSGEVFSFNEVVGERSTERGYRIAPVILKGERAYDEGGGVCQVSSTLYNSVKAAGLEVLERHSHSKDVHYLHPGEDAAVEYGTMDFKFKNTKEFAIKIEAYVMNNKMITAIIKAE